MPLNKSCRRNLTFQTLFLCYGLVEKQELSFEIQVDLNQGTLIG